MKLKIERITFINSKGQCKYGYIVDNDENICGYDDSLTSSPSLTKITKEDDFDLIESVLNEFPDFFDNPKNKNFTIMVDENIYNYSEFIKYIKKNKIKNILN